MRASRSGFATIVVASCIALFASQGRAATYAPLADTELMKRSPVIVLAEPIRSEGILEEVRRSRLPVTITTFRMIEVLKGFVPQQTFRVRVAGGAAAGMNWQVIGQPKFTAGQLSLLFLAPTHDSSDFVLSEFGLSKFDIVNDAKSDRFAIRFLDGSGPRQPRSPQLDARPFEAFVRSLRSHDQEDALPVGMSLTVPLLPLSLVHVDYAVKPMWGNIGGSEWNGNPRLARWFWNTGTSPAAVVTAVGKQTNLSDGSDGSAHLGWAIGQWASIPNTDVRLSGPTASGNVNVHFDVDQEEGAWSGPLDCRNSDGGVIGLGGPVSNAASESYRGDSYTPITGAAVLLRTNTCSSIPYDVPLFRTVVLHELGHGLGLMHPNQVESFHSTTAREDWATAVMNSGAGSNRLPGIDDIRAMQFYYGSYTTPPPSIVSIVPASGPLSGGTVVTLEGSQFQNGADVVVGGVRVSSVSVTDLSTMVIVTPPHSAGFAKVAVCNPDGQGATVPNGFTFVDPVPLTVDILVPRSGPVEGGTAFALFGAGFSVSATVTFGGQPATSVVVTATRISGVTPTHTAGATDVVVTNPNGTLFTLPAGFTYGLASAAGDPNQDGAATAADVFYLINFLFAGGVQPVGSADANGDGIVTVGDVVFLINYLFGNGPLPRAPEPPTLYVNPNDSRIVSTRDSTGETITLYGKKDDAGLVTQLVAISREPSDGTLGDVALLDTHGQPVSVSLRTGAVVTYYYGPNYIDATGIHPNIIKIGIRFPDGRVVHAASQLGGTIAALAEGPGSESGVTNLSAAGEILWTTNADTFRPHGRVFVTQECGIGFDVGVSGADVWGRLLYPDAPFCSDKVFVADDDGGGAYSFPIAANPVAPELLQSIATQICSMLSVIYGPEWICNSTNGTKALRTHIATMCPSLLLLGPIGPEAFAACEAAVATWTGVCALQFICKSVDVGNSLITGLFDSAQQSCNTSRVQMKLKVQHPLRGGVSLTQDFLAGSSPNSIIASARLPGISAQASAFAGLWYAPTPINYVGMNSEDLYINITDDGCEIFAEFYSLCSGRYNYCREFANRNGGDQYRFRSSEALGQTTLTFTWQESGPPGRTPGSSGDVGEEGSITLNPDGSMTCTNVLGWGSKKLTKVGPPRPSY